MKKKILIASCPLNPGGTTSALLNLLKKIDYEKLDVTLALEKYEGDFLDEIPKEVKVFASKKDKTIWDKLWNKTIYLLKGVYFLLLYYKFFKKDKGSLYRYQIMSGIGGAAVSKKAKGYFDMALGFMEGWPNNYVIKKVNAQKKHILIHPDYKSCGLDKDLDRYLFEKADYILFVAPALKESFDNMLPQYKQKTGVLKNIVDRDEIAKKADEKADFEFHKNYFNIVTLSRLRIFDKGIDIAIEAAEKLKESGVKFRWYVLGWGEDYKALQKMVYEKGLSGMFFLCGAKKNPYPYLKNADLFVLTSRYEGLPVSVTEAQMLGVVVLVTNYLTAREQVKDNYDGLVADCTAESIYNGIYKLYTDKEFYCKLKRSICERDFSFDVESFYSLV